MSNNKPKRQHYIPQFLLKNLCDANGYLWVGDGRSIYPTNPTNAFVKKDLTTKFTPSGQEHGEFDRSYEYEEGLSKIESEAAPAVQEIIKQARRGRCPQISSALSHAWKRFFYSLARRTPESQQRVLSDSKFEDVWYEAAKALADEKNYPLPDKASLYQDPNIRNLMNISRSNVNARFAAGDHPHEKSEEERFSRETGLCVAIIRMSDREFSIGSHGITIVESGHRSDPAKGSWLPIAHDVAVKATAFPDREILAFLARDNDGDRIITAINRATTEQSQIIAGRSEALIRSLTQG